MALLSHRAAPAAAAAALSLLAAVLLIASAPTASADCSLPCSCALGVEFGEDLCDYTNTTLDIKAVQVRAWAPRGLIVVGKSLRSARRPPPSRLGVRAAHAGGARRSRGAPRWPAGDPPSVPHPPHLSTCSATRAPAAHPRRHCLQEKMAPLATPDFADALAIYNSGRFAYRDDGVTLRTLIGVSRRK